MYEVSASAMTLTRTFALANSTEPDSPDGARGIPNYLTGITISPDGVAAWVPSKQDNMSRGSFRDGQPLNFEVSVRPVVSRLNLVHQRGGPGGARGHQRRGPAVRGGR